MPYKAGGTIDCITPGKLVTTVVMGLTEPRDIVWTGGTPYGENLYVADHSGYRIRRIDLNGNVNDFAAINSPQATELDRVGTYGGYLYTGPRLSDHIDRLLTDGQLQRFSDFPYGMPGGPSGIAFDPGADYGGLMYVTTDSTLDVDWLRVHSLDVNGNPTRFAPDIAIADRLKFDPVGLFGNKLFIDGRAVRNDPRYIWRVDPDGSATQFAIATNMGAYTFGLDGAMYLHEVDDGVATISRISFIPEPASILLLGLGGFFVRRVRSIR